MTIILYDIPSTIPGNGWTPNPFKARTVLNFKGIPYRTEWVEYPDIESVCKKIGAPPTTKELALDGSGQLVDLYTLPVIYDSKTGKAISESYAITEYLEETYPDTPRVIPPGTEAAIALFNKFVGESIISSLVPLVIPNVPKRLNKKSAEYFSKSRDIWYNQKLEDLSPPGPKRDELWSKVKKGLTTLAGFYEKNKEGQQTFFIGNSLTYADIVIGSFLFWPKVILFKEDFDWEEIANADGGLWGRLANELERHRQIL